MGTNYYIRPTNTACHHYDHWIHLGKSSMGLRFTFQAYPRGAHLPFTETPTWPVVDYVSWLRLFDLGEIYDEYGDRVNKPYLRDLVERKRNQQYILTGDDYLDEGGHHFIRGEFS